MINPTPGISLVSKLLIGGLTVATVGGVYVATQQPLMFQFVSQKVNDIVTPKPLIGTLTPARDLRGTWSSSLRGKGFQIYGVFVTGPATTKVYEDGDIELKIDSVENNIGNGQITYSNMCATGETTVPGVKTFSVPKTCNPNSGAQPVTMKISGSAIEFTTPEGTVMAGSFTTDIMSGAMSLNTPSGVLKGEFHLSRQK
ncbi:MAG: hypothetical protein WC843_03990 [Candidatus Gracilibacteria bacterium]|jgi:hypothetical protein